MPKRDLIGHYFAFKAAVITTAALFSSPVLANNCPVSYNSNIENNVVGSFEGQTIYFCKQDFQEDALVFKPTKEELLPGGNQVISKGSTIQTQPLTNSVNLAGFNAGNLAFNNNLSAYYPNKDGRFNSRSLFNFFTRINKRADCTNQYQLIRNFLRSNPNVFQTIPQSGSNEPQIAGNDLVKISNAKLNNVADSAKTLSADIYLYHANANLGGQFFTQQYRDCWVGVGSRVELNPNNGNLKYAGDYKLAIGVNVK